jgi:putative DNA primase/helicase
MIGMPRAKTISDRSFVIQLKRKSRGEKTDNKTKGIIDRCRPVRSMLLRWANDNAERISSCCESLPPSDNDRADDNWATLFTIASVIGGSWPEKVKNARNLIDDSLEDDALGTQLLTDIRDIFDEQSAEKVFSNDLIEKLNAISDSPWGDWNKGRGLTTNGLARLLKPFGVTSKTMRIDGLLAKGYNLKSFQDAFTRYIPPIQNVTPLQTNEFDNLGEKQNVTFNLDVTDENFDNKLNLFDCYDVTDGIGATQGDKKIDVEKTKKWEIGTI